MANTPFTPSRSALGDISNHKLFKSEFKMPNSIITEEIEKTFGEAYREESILESEIFEFSTGKSPLQSPRDYYFRSHSISIKSDEFIDNGFKEVEAEIEFFIDSGITYNVINGLV